MVNSPTLSKMGSQNGFDHHSQMVLAQSIGHVENQTPPPPPPAIRHVAGGGGSGLAAGLAAAFLAPALGTCRAGLLEGRKWLLVVCLFACLFVAWLVACLLVCLLVYCRGWRFDGGLLAVWGPNIHRAFP